MKKLVLVDVLNIDTFVKNNPQYNGGAFTIDNNGNITAQYFYL